MRDLLDRILDLPKSQKLGVLVGIIVLLLGLYYTFVLSSLSYTMEDLTGQLQTAEADRNKKRAIASNHARLEAETKKLRAMLGEAITLLPNKKEVPALLENISTKARQSGLQVMLFRPRPETYQEFYAEIPVDIHVRGGYHNIVDFFDEVGKMQRLVNITNIELRNPKVGGDQMTLETSTVATTFRFLDEAERKKIAQQKAQAGSGRRRR